MVRLPSSFDGLSIDQLYGKYGKPEMVPISRCDGEPLPPNVPEKAVLPLFLERLCGRFYIVRLAPMSR